LEGSSFRQYYRELHQRHQTSEVVGGEHVFKSLAVIVVLALVAGAAVMAVMVLGRAFFDPLVLAVRCNCGPSQRITP